MKTILSSLFVIAIIFNVSANTYTSSNTSSDLAISISANPDGGKKGKRGKTTSCGIGNFKKKPTKARKIFSAIIPFALVSFSAVMATNPRRR